MEQIEIDPSSRSTSRGKDGMMVWAQSTTDEWQYKMFLTDSLWKRICIYGE